MSDADIVILGAAHVNEKGVPLVQAVIPLSDDVEDVESFGEIDMLQVLGLSSLPYPKDDKGHAEGVVLRNVGNRDAILVGARDTRTADIVGKLKPGDVALHTTGPKQAAQLQLKEDTQQAALITKSSKKKTMMFLLDGENDKVQLTAFGCIFEFTAEGNINLTAKGEIMINAKKICLAGDVILGGTTPNPAMKIMTAPAPSPGGAASLPMVPAPGVSIGV